MDFEIENQHLIGIFTIDAEFIVRVWDGALERMTGISASDARGKSVVEIIPNLETRGLLARFKRVLEEGTIEILAPAFHRFLISCPPQFASKHFDEMRQRVTIAPLKENEAIRGLIVTIEDVTGRIEREMELAALLKDPDAGRRLKAAKAISESGESLAGDDAAPVIDALGDKNWRVRRELVDGLARRAAPEAIAALLRAMREKHLDFGVLNSALQILQATSVKTTETLIEFLRGDDADLRMQAALTLGEQRDARAIPALLAALEDENVNVRYHAIEALGKLKAGEEAVAPLLEIAETRDFFLSFVALDALRQIGGEPAADRIIPLLDDAFLQAAAIDAIGAIGGKTAVLPLVGVLNKDKFSAGTIAAALGSLYERFEKDFSTGAEIIQAARQSISADGKSNLAAALDEANKKDLPVIAGVAGWFDDERIREKLALLLEDEDAGDHAARALAGQRGGAGIDLLIDALESGEPETRKSAARALGESKNERALAPLIDLLRTGDAALRLAAAGALKSLAHPETVPRLSGLLNDADPHVREAAIRVAGHFGAEACESAIFALCEDEDERVRRAALEQLPNIRDERALIILIRVLKEGRPRERETAAKALAQIKSEVSAAALREALNDADHWTRYFAVRALGVLRDAASRAKLFEMAEKDEAEFVRAAAGEVLREMEE